MADWTDSFRNSESTATVEKPLEPVSTPQPAAQGDWTDSFRQQPNPNLSLKAASDIPSDKAAQVLRLQDQTGLPTHVIGPNLEDVKAKQDQVSLSPQFIQDHPKTTDLLGSDQHWAALLRDDIPGVAFMERQLDYLANASMRSELELERTYHGLKGVAGLGGPDNSDRIAQIDKQLQTQFKPPAGANPLTQLFGKTSEVAVPYGVPLALGAIEGVPATIAAAAAFGAMETSNAYLDYKNKVDREGNQIPDDTARRWAVASGALTAGLSLLGPSGKAAANPALKMLSRGALGEMMEDTGLRLAIDKLLTSSIPSSMLKTGAFFGGSTWGHVAAGVMADSKDMSPMAILRTIFSPENNKQVLKATATGAAVGGTITAGMGAWNIWTDFSRAQEALNTQTAVMNVGNAMKNTKAFDIAPDQVPKVMDRLAGDGHKYIPLEKWQEWAETQKVDPRQAWQEATGSTQAYDEALKTGSDLQMSSKAYFSRIAASDHNEFFSKVLRSNPEAMNAEEAEAFLGKQTPEAQAKREAIYKVKEAVAPTPQETTSMNVPEPLPTPETEPITPAPQTAEIVPRPTSTGLPVVTPNEEALNAKGKPYALFVGNQEGVGPMYNVYGEHPTLSTGRYMHSTVSEETIKKEGIPVIGKTDKAKGEPEPMVSPEQKIANQHIDAAKQDLGHKPLDLEGLGMTETQVAGIREAEARSHQAAQDQMVKAITDRQRNQATKEWMDERSGVQKEVEQEIISRPEYRAINVLQGKLSLGEGIEPFKLSRQIVEQEDISGSTRGYPEGIMADKGGIEPDEAAAMLGFNSGSELLYKLKTAPKFEDVVSQETNRRMQDAHPELQFDTNMPEAAIKAIYNNAHGDLLRAQLKHFYTNEFAAAKGLTGKIAGRIPVTDELKADVMRDIGVKNWYALQPRQYIQAMRNNQMEAEKALKAGNFQGMVDAKRAELRSFEMYRAAQNARDAIEQRMAKIPRYFKRQFQEMLGKAGGTYRDDVNKLLTDSTFQNYKTMPYNVLMNHLEQIDSKIHETREQGKVYALANFTRVDDYRTGIIGQIGEDFKLTENELGFPKPRLTNETPFLPSTQAHLTRMEFYFDHLDNWKPNGLAKQGFSDPMAVSRGHEGDLTQRQIFDLPKYNLNEMVEKIPFSERALWYAKKHFIPEIQMSLFKPNMIRIARYRQNDYAWNALLDGFGWTDAQGMAVISRLSKEELDLVDGMSKWFEALKEESFAKYKQFHGIAPEPVQPSPHEITMQDGTIRKMEGGYSPVTFASSLSKGGQTVEDVFGSTWGPAKPSESHLKARTNTDRRPLSLDLNDELRVMGQMIHWVSFADAVADANKFIGDKAIKAHMIAALGEESFKEIPKWLKDIAGNNPFASSPIDRLYSMAKNASMIANLGFKTTSELKHILNTTMTLKELGLQHWAKGIQTFIGNPMKTLQRWEEIKAMSPFMRQWAANIDKDISQAAKRLNIAGESSIFGAETLIGRAMSVKTALTHDFVRTMFSLYGIAYTSIGGSAFEGAYMKAMDGMVEGIKAGDEKNAISYAERVVRTTIASGNTEDLPSMMRDKGMSRLFTWFYGPMNLLANNVQKDYQRFRGSEKTPSDIAKFAGAEFLNIIPAALIGSVLANEAPKAKDKLSKWVKWGLGAVAGEFAGMVPILRDIPYAIKSRGHQFNDPFLDVFSSAAWSTMDLIKHAEHHARFSTSEIKRIGMTVGYFTELPSRQVMDSWAVAHDWMAHHYRPSSTASGLWHVATGKEPKRG